MKQSISPPPRLLLCLRSGHGGAELKREPLTEVFNSWIQSSFAIDLDTNDLKTMHNRTLAKYIHAIIAGWLLLASVVAAVEPWLGGNAELVCADLSEETESDSEEDFQESLHHWFHSDSTGHLELNRVWIPRHTELVSESAPSDLNTQRWQRPPPTSR